MSKQRILRVLKLPNNFCLRTQLTIVLLACVQRKQTVRDMRATFKNFAVVLIGCSSTCITNAMVDTSSTLNSPTESSQLPSSLVLQLENDFFVGSDQDYTNGFRLSYLSSSKTISHDSFLASDLFCIDATPALQTQWGVSLSQLMFTPEHKTDHPLFNEHPYAGLLSLGLGGIVKNEERSNSFELQLGVTGQPSLAHSAQRRVHSFWGMEQWPSWRYQIPSEFAFCFNFKRDYRLHSLESTYSDGFATDGYFYWNADLGTIYVRGGGGINFRFGYNLPNDTPTDMTLAGGNFQTSPFAKTIPSVTSNWSVYGIMGASIRAVAHDIFLDGTVFHDTPYTVDKFPVVGSWYLGAGCRYKSLDVIFAFSWQTKEYHNQESLHCVGSAELRWSF